MDTLQDWARLECGALELRTRKVSPGARHLHTGDSIQGCGRATYGEWQTFADADNGCWEWFRRMLSELTMHAIVFSDGRQPHKLDLQRLYGNGYESQRDWLEAYSIYTLKDQEAGAAVGLVSVDKQVWFYIQDTFQERTFLIPPSDFQELQEWFLTNTETQKKAA